VSKSIFEIMEIQNNHECFVQLWRMLGRTRRLCRLNCQRFTVRRVLQLWFDPEATDEFIWQVCNISELSGMDQLPSPRLYPRPHRELLRALVIVRLGLGASQVKLSDLDAAYSAAYPNSTPLNISRKKKYRKP
jgi:hypothetical protein